MPIARTLFLACSALAQCSLAQPLPSIKLNASGLTVSGISAGAFMAVQFEFAHAAVVRGAGIVAGGPYHCAGANGGFVAYAACCELPTTINVTALAAYARHAAASGLIDPVEHLLHHTVHMFSGIIDAMVSHGTMIALAALYTQLGVPTQSIFNVTAEHAWITSMYGASCATLAAPFINNCNIDFAGTFLAAAAAAAGRPWNTTIGRCVTNA